MTFGDIITYPFIFLSLYIAIVYFLALIENKDKLYKPSLNKNYPKVAIIVPCFNEQENIVQVVNSLLNLDYPKDKLEIIIVDDGSTDQTYAKAKSLEKYNQVRAFTKKNGGKFSALNHGLKQTKAEFVGCLDADSFVKPQALKRIMTYFLNDKKVMAVTASLKIHQPKGILLVFQKVEYIINIFLRKIFAFLNSIYITPGPFSIFRKKIFDEIGPYKHAYGTEDLEICLRIQNNHYKVENAPDAYVYTIGPRSFKGLYNQRIRWYHGFIKNIWDYRHLLGNKKYGNLGLFILPTTLLSILFLSFNVVRLSINLIQTAINQFIKLNAIGVNLNQLITPSTNTDWNWVLLNTLPSVFMYLSCFVIPIIFILIGKKISKERLTPKEIMVELVLCIPLYIIWWIGAFYNVIFNKKIGWKK